MKIYVLSVSNSEGCCEPSVFNTKEEARKALQEAYNKEVDEWVDENGNLIKVDEEGEKIYNPIVDYELHLKEGNAFVTYEDNEVHFEISEEELETNSNDSLFAQLFIQTLSAMMNQNGGSIETAMDDAGIKDDETKELVKEAFDWEDDGEYDDEDDENDWDGCCPYCHSGNTDFVDSDEDSTKYICRDCNEDFIVHNDGHITTRNGFPIQKEERKLYTISVNNEILSDSDGNSYRFDSAEDALNFIKENEIENAEIVKQYGLSENEEV